MQLRRSNNFETEKKPVDELFVFHGTSGKILRPRIVLLYCIETMSIANLSKLYIKHMFMTS